MPTRSENSDQEADMYLENLNEKFDDKELHNAFFGQVKEEKKLNPNLANQNEEKSDELQKLRDQVMKIRKEKRQQEEKLKNPKLGKEAEKLLTPLEKRRLKYKRDVKFIYFFKEIKLFLKLSQLIMLH